MSQRTANFEHWLPPPAAKQVQTKFEMEGRQQSSFCGPTRKYTQYSYYQIVDVFKEQPYGHHYHCHLRMKYFQHGSQIRWTVHL